MGEEHIEERFDTELAGGTDNNGMPISPTATEEIFSYDGDKLVQYGFANYITYDKLGCPSSYNGNECEWSFGKLKRYGGTNFTYDGYGRRISKDGTTFTYDTEGKLKSQNGGNGNINFIYNGNEIIGIDYNSDIYYFRKDMQGNVIEIAGGSGGARYIYDAWGNCKIIDAVGNDITLDMTNIGYINPIRYRGYYYDTETNLYYLNTRYYDPTTGRFISPDSLEYLDPETINGLNLYAYCGNNPVMGYDPNGTWDWDKFWRTLGVLVVAALVTAATIAICIVTVGTAAPVLIGAGIGFALGMGVSAISQATLNGSVDIGKMFLDGFVGAISGAIAVTGIGLLGSTIVGGVLGGATSVGEDVIDGKEINVSKFWLSVGIGAIGGLISGSGADSKTLIGKSQYFKEVLKTAVSPKKIAMYTAKQIEIYKTIAISAVRFSASIVTSHWVTKGLGKLFGW